MMLVIDLELWLTYPAGTQILVGSR